MFLKTLKHFAILKLKELGKLCLWIVSIAVGLAVLLAPGQIVLRNSEHFKFLGELARIDTQHQLLQLWVLGMAESVLFWLSAFLLIFAGYTIIAVVKNWHSLDYKRRFKQWCSDNCKQLIACGVFLLLGFGLLCFSGIFHSVMIHPWGIGKKVLGITVSAFMVGLGLFVVGSTAHKVINGVYIFFRNNWRCAKVLAEKESLCK